MMPLRVGIGVAVPLGQKYPAGHSPDPFADVDAASQKNPGGQGCACEKLPLTTVRDPVPLRQYVPGEHGYGLRVVSFLNGSDV